MTDLSEASIEAALMYIKASAEQLFVRPKKLLIPRIQGETYKQYWLRVQKAKRMAARLKKD